MEQISVYYDDRDSRCREYIRCLSQYDNVSCKQASRYEGKKEMKALKSTVNHLEKRGYHVLQCFSPYLLEKRNLSIQQRIKRIMNDICEADNLRKVSDIEAHIKSEMKTSRSLRKSKGRNNEVCTLS